MVVTRDPELAKRMKVMRLHGMSRDAFDRFTATVPSWYYEIVAPGFKYNLTDIAAALGLQQLKRIDGFQKRRVELADALDAGLAGLPLILPPTRAAGDQHSWHLYVVRLTDDAKVVARRRSSSACSPRASASACTTSRCTCSRTGATATRSRRSSSRTASARSSAWSACRCTRA